MSVHAPEIQSLRERLWDAGFRPVPVYNFDVPRSQWINSPGKQPVGKAWEQNARQNPPTVLSDPMRNDALNTGILCDGLRAVDIDVDDRVKAHAVRALAIEMLGEPPIRQRRNSPRSLLVYRAAEGQPSKLVLPAKDGSKIEVLGHGQQFVAFGRHESGAELEWIPEAPGDISADALPAVTEEQVAAFLDAVAPILGADPPRTKPNGHDHGGPGAHGTSSAGTKADDALDVVAALVAIPNAAAPDWERWNRIGMATWAATGGSSAGFAAWVAWSEKNPAHDDAACRERWNHYPTSPPDEIGAGTLFKLARDAQPGWTKPSLGRAGNSNTQADLGIWDAGEDDYSKVPPRGWLLGNAFCRRFLSSLLADGGVGKTAVRLAQLISLATGRSLTGEHVFHRCRVLVLSFEDDRDELRRRVYAVLRHYKIDVAEIRGWLFLAAPKGIKLAEMRDNQPQLGALDKLLRDEISNRQLDVVSLDPFIKTHGLEENSNNAVDFVCGLLASIAIDLNCAIDLPHHTNKGTSAPGDANRGRGASAMKDAARLVYTLTPMSPEEAAAFGLSEKERRAFVRLDSGKVNIAPPLGDAKWFRLMGVPLQNRTDEYPRGDEVQTVEPWTPPEAKVASLTDLDALAMAIGQGCPARGGEPWSPLLSKTDRSVRHLLEKHGFARADAQKETMAKLKAEHAVEVAQYWKPNRAAASGLRVGGKPVAPWSDEAPA